MGVRRYEEENEFKWIGISEVFNNYYHDIVF